MSMRSKRMFQAVDSHTEGMPTRVVTGGVGVFPGATMAQRRLFGIKERDDLRLLLMQEPRGHSAMSGAILQPPARADADWGVLYIEVSGWLPMCGHGTIGVATVLVETGMVPVTEPVTTIRLDTPAGLVEARVEVRDGSAVGVTIRNVPSFLYAQDVVVDVPDVGSVTLDLAFGGNFYALLPASALGMPVLPRNVPAMLDQGLKIMDAVMDQAPPSHPLDPGIDDCRHVVAYEDGRDGADARAVTLIHPGWVDRSPCGTGTSARMAALHARGALALGQDFVNESVLGTRFTGRLVESTTVGPFSAVVPTVTGRAWVTGIGTYLLDPSDPFPAGFAL
jgi:proline racemase